MSPSELRFEPTVLDAFKFLSSQFGFSCHESTPTSVLYTSANVEVEITLDPRSYEIDVEVKRIAENRSFPLHRIIEMSSPPEAKRWSLIQTSTPDRVEEFVPKLAGLLQEYGKTALSGDAKIFAKLADLEESEAGSGVSAEGMAISKLREGGLNFESYPGRVNRLRIRAVCLC
jgi:hypothetical protein